MFLTLLKSAGIVFSLSTPKLSNLVCKPAKSIFDASIDASMSVSLFRLPFVA